MKGESHPLVADTDPKSLFVYVHEQGTVPENRRLLLDPEILRDQVRDDNVHVKWTGRAINWRMR